MKRLRNNNGFTVTELLICMFMTGIMAAAGFNFYISMNNQTLAQEEISDIQQTTRASLEDISKNLRKAGYRIGSHPAYTVSNDSLYVFYNDTRPVDSILYYLDDFEDDELPANVNYPNGLIPRKLMKQVNGNAPVLFAEYINDIQFIVHSPSLVEVILEVQSSKADEDFSSDQGYRVYAANEMVSIRNLNL